MTISLKPDVLRHVVDVHCHPTDAGNIPPEAMENLEITICAMASMQSDQRKVAALAEAYPDKVIPCFGRFYHPSWVLSLSKGSGYHPWFSHSISLDSSLSKEQHYRKLLLHDSSPPKAEQYAQTFDQLFPLLPEPVPLSDIIVDLRDRLTKFPDAMIGEVGLDRSFRVPFDYFAEDRKLTPFTIPVEHQLAILEAQLDLAVEFQRNASIHSVKAQQATVELLHKLAKKHGDSWYRISVDMHSCGFSPETWRDIEV